MKEANKYLRKEEKLKAKEKTEDTSLNSVSQKRARRDKKGFLSDHCNEIEENNRMEKTRDLFRKIGNIKGTSHARMGRIKDENGKDRTEADVDDFLELSCFFDDPKDVGNLISCCSAFSKFSLNICKFTVHILLRPGLKNSEHFFTTV